MDGTMGHRLVGRVALVYHSRRDPSDDEWRSFLDQLSAEARKAPMHGILVLSDGGSPGSAQRRLLAKQLEDLPVGSAAIVSDSAVMRGVLTALRWLGFEGTYSAFSHADIDAAWAYIGVTGATRRQLQKDLEELRTAVLKFDARISSTA